MGNVQEVLKKAEELVTLLEEQNATAAVLNKQLSDKKLEQEDVDRKLSAASNQLGARERIVKNIENVKDEKDRVAESIKRTNDKRIENAKKEEEIATREKGIKAKEDELATLSGVFKEKNKMFDEKLADMEIEREVMHNKIKEKVYEAVKGNFKK
jgi:hypothetical protein